MGRRGVGSLLGQETMSSYARKHRFTLGYVGFVGALLVGSMPSRRRNWS
jgi:hypothetical protein